MAPDFTGPLKRSSESASHPRIETPGGTFTLKPFMMGLPALDVFPFKLWARLSARHARMLTLPAMAVPDPAGYFPLREAVASYLAVSRGILCSTDQVIITSGLQSALGLITRALLQPGDQVWLEDPCYFVVRMALKAIGAEVVGVPVDQEGINVTAGIARGRHARFTYVTPSHQAPLGVSMLGAAHLLATRMWWLASPPVRP